MTLKNQGCWLAPDGAVPAASRLSSMTSRGTGRLSKSRTVRRRTSSAWKARARSIISGCGYSR